MPIKIFISYDSNDEKHLRALETHLAPLRRQQLIDDWHARKIEFGEDSNRVADRQLEAAAIILLLVSPDFLHSTGRTHAETMRALARQEAGEATVIPILVRACDWRSSPFGTLHVLPDREKPVTKWDDHDTAWESVVGQIRRAVEKRTGNAQGPDDAKREPRPTVGGVEAHPPAPGRYHYARAWLPSALFILPVVIAVTALFVRVAPNDAAPWKLALTWVHFGQLVAVVSVYIWEWSHRANDPDHRDERDRDLVEPFARHWNWLWLSWCFFFLFHTVRGFYEHYKWHGAPPPTDWLLGMNIANNLLHNLQSALLFILFWMMIRPNWGPGSFWFALKSWGAPAGLWSIGLAVGQVLLWIALHSSYQYFLSDLIAAVVAGVSAAAFMGMFIGRLESAFLDVHPVELAVLYVYAGIQPFFRVLASLRVLGSTQVVSASTIDFVQPFMQPFFELSLIALAGTFKLGLYFVVRRQLTSGRLVFYMREQRALRAKVQDDWRRFRQDAAGGTASGGPEQR